MVESEQYTWALAEDIANNMKIIFMCNEVSDKIRCKALELATYAAYKMTRFAAMDTCAFMIKSVDNDKLGLYVGTIIQKYKYDFIKDIEVSQCNCSSIKKVLLALQ